MASDRPIPDALVEQVAEAQSDYPDTPGWQAMLRAEIRERLAAIPPLTGPGPNGEWVRFVPCEDCEGHYRLESL
jgi:hypothetical protein